MNKLHLIDLKEGDKAIINGIANRCKAKRRLYELGLHKGVKFEVIKNNIGPVILSVSGSKLAIGRGLANKIYVETCLD